VYCANNPIKLIDPNGKEVWLTDENGERTQQITEKDMKTKSDDKRIQTMQNIYNSGKDGKKVMNQIMSSKKNSFEISEKSEWAPGGQVSQDNVVTWGDPENESYGGNDMDVLTEELFHCKQIDDGLWNWSGGKGNLDLEVQAKEFTAKVSQGFNKYYRSATGFHVPTAMYIMSGSSNLNINKHDYLSRPNYKIPAFNSIPDMIKERNPDTYIEFRGGYIK
jgi:hypothetical protein